MQSLSTVSEPEDDDRRMISGSSRPGSRRRSRTLIRIGVSLAVLGVLAVGAYFGRSALRAARASEARERGLAAFEQKDWAAALGDLGTAVAFDQTNTELLTKYGEARANVPQPGGRHLAEAARIYRVAMDAGAPRLEMLRKLLRVYADFGALVETAETAEAILAIVPGDREAITALVGTLWARGKDEDAVKVLESAIALMPADLGLRTALINTLERIEEDKSAVLARIDAWLVQPDAPRALRDVRLAFALDHKLVDEPVFDPPFDDSWKPASVEEARTRAELLYKIGRIDDACAALRRAREAGMDDVGLMRDEFRIRFFAGDVAGASELCESKGGGSDAPDGDRAFFRAVLAVAAPDSSAAVQALEAFKPAVGSPAATWRENLLASFKSGKPPVELAPARIIAELVPTAVAVYEMRRAWTLRAAEEPLRASIAAERAFKASEESWWEAGVLLARTRLEAGKFGLANNAARLTWLRNQERYDVLALVIESETAQRLAGLAAGRDISGLERDARNLLEKKGLGADARRVALQALLLCGQAEFAREEARKILADPTLTVRDAKAIATVGASLSRLDGKPEFAEAAAARLEALGADPFEIAEVRAIAAEIAGDPLRGLELLVMAAGDSRAKLAKAAEYADRLLPDRAPELWLKSLPDGAGPAVLSRAARANADLARKAFETLAAEGATTRVAIARLRLSTALPDAFPLDKALYEAEERRKIGEPDPLLLVEMGDALLNAREPDPRQAANLYLLAYKADTDRADFLLRALKAYSQLGDLALLGLTAEQLLNAAGGDLNLRYTAIIALCEAGRAKDAAAAARALAFSLVRDEYFALAGRAQALAGDAPGAERFLREVIARPGEWPESVKSLVGLLRANGRGAEAEQILSSEGYADDPVLAAIAAVEQACRSGSVDSATGAIAVLDLGDDRLKEFARTLAIGGGPCGEAALARIEAVEGAAAAGRVRLVARTFVVDPSAMPTLAEAREAAKAAPQDWTGWLALIRTASRRGEIAAALEAVRESRKSCPSSLPLLQSSVDALISGGALDEARTLISPFRGASGLDPTVRLASATLEIAEGRGERALAELDALADASVRAANTALRVRAAALAGRYDAAAEARADAALVEPDIGGMMSVDEALKLVDALRARGGLLPSTEARLLAKIALRRPADASLASAAAESSRRALGSTGEPPIERATAAFTAAVASGDAAAIDAARAAMVSATDPEVGALLASSAGDASTKPLSRRIAGLLAYNEAEAILDRGGDPARALALADRSKQLLAGRPEPEELRARALLASGRAQDAAASLAGARALPKLFALRAEAFIALGKRKEALEDSARAAAALERTPHAPIDLKARIADIERRARDLPIAK